ncbi:MAG: ATP-binding protein [Longimicrobiales bacterium]
MTERQPGAASLTAAAAWGAATASSFLLLLWTRRLHAPLLVAGGLFLILAALVAWRLRSHVAGTRALLAACATLAVALLIGGLAERQFARIEFEWDAVVAEREQRLAERLANHMSAVTDRGRLAAESAAEVPDTARAAAFAWLAEVRSKTGVDALMLFDEVGGLVAWAGDHRGAIPEVVRNGITRPYYGEKPLYSYLYFTSPVKVARWQAVAAVLVETGEPVRVGDDPTTRTVAARTTVPAVFRSGPGRGEGVVWTLDAGRDTVVHARLERITQTDLRDSVSLAVRRASMVFLVIAMVMLAAGWLRHVQPAGRRGMTAIPLLLAPLAFALAPWGPVLGLEDVFSPVVFFPPSTGEPSLGELIVIMLPIAALAATLRLPRFQRKAWYRALVPAGLLVGIAYPLVTRFALTAATPSLLTGSAPLWFGLQTAMTIMLATVTALLIPRRVGEHAVGSAPRAATALGAGFALAIGLAFLVALRLEPNLAGAPLLAAVWAVPFALVAIGIRHIGSQAVRWARWLAAGAFAATAVLPQLWIAHSAARLQAAEREIASFGATTPAWMDFLLLEFGREVTSRHAAGETGLQLLYRSWVASGLAQEPYAARITLWSDDGEPEEWLGLGGAEGSDAAEPGMPFVVRNAARDTTARIVPADGFPDVSRLLTVPVDTDHVVTVTIPPRRTLQPPGVIAPFLGGAVDPDAMVSIVEPAGGPPPPDSMHWTPAEEGWRGVVGVQYPNGLHHAHITLRVTPLEMRFVRAVLIIALDLAILALLLVGGHVARGISVLPKIGIRSLANSFRTRITFALFAFFLLPTIAFGSLAFGALASVVERAAGVVAARAVQQAVIEWPQVDGDLRVLAARTGTDVLYYFNGELAEASSPEARELGVYGAWMSPDVFLRLDRGEETTDQEIANVAGESYLTAYQSLRPTGTLAAPNVLTAGDTAARQREIRDLILLAALLGGVLSMILSLAVGRALAGPIGRLRRAAAAVGKGRLRVRLPEQPGDEFGQLFGSFNRMVRRLRRARTQEVRTARVLAWGEMAQQIAHEIKNPLTPIKLAVQHLRRAYRDDRRDFGHILDSNVDQILNEIDRLAEISRAFSRYGAPAMQAGPLINVDVGSATHAALALYRAGDSRINYAERVESGLAAVRSRPAELHEVLMNLLENARHAVNDGGRIEVRAHASDGRIELEVADDGVGIPPELMPRIFEPHFSTRSTGTGLGLAIVRRLVESWGGTIDAISDANVGTVVRMRLQPAAQTDEPSGDGP